MHTVTVTQNIQAEETSISEAGCKVQYIKHEVMDATVTKSFSKRLFDQVIKFNIIFVSRTQTYGICIHSDFCHSYVLDLATCVKCYQIYSM